MPLSTELERGGGGGQMGLLGKSVLGKRIATKALRQQCHYVLEAARRLVRLK